MSKLATIGHRLYTGEISYDFIGHRRRWYILSAILISIAIISLVFFFVAGFLLLTRVDVRKAVAEARGEQPVLL